MTQIDFCSEMEPNIDWSNWEEVNAHVNAQFRDPWAELHQGKAKKNKLKKLISCKAEKNIICLL